MGRAPMRYPNDEFNIHDTKERNKDLEKLRDRPSVIFHMQKKSYANLAGVGAAALPVSGSMSH